MDVLVPELMTVLELHQIKQMQQTKMTTGVESLLKMEQKLTAGTIPPVIFQLMWRRKTMLMQKQLPIL